jgi:hypothetical protein
MQKRCTVIILALATILSASAVVGAQTNESRRPDAIELFPIASPTARSLFTPDTLDTSIAQQPAGPPSTPRHTGIKALTKHLVTNFRYLPSKENLFWAGGGGGLALAAHPFDDNVNERLVGNDTADRIFKAGRGPRRAGYAPRQCVGCLRRWTRQRRAESLAPWDGPD